MTDAIVAELVSVRKAFAAAVRKNSLREEIVQACWCGVSITSLHTTFALSRELVERSKGDLYRGVPFPRMGGFDKLILSPPFILREPQDERRAGGLIKDGL